MTAAPPSAPLRLGPDEVSAELLADLRDGAVVAAPAVAVVDLLGAGAVACFKGLLTNDVVNIFLTTRRRGIISL